MSITLKQKQQHLSLNKVGLIYFKRLDSYLCVTKFIIYLSNYNFYMHPASLTYSHLGPGECCISITSAPARLTICSYA